MQSALFFEFAHKRNHIYLIDQMWVSKIREELYKLFSQESLHLLVYVLASVAELLVEHLVGS